MKFEIRYKCHKENPFAIKRWSIETSLGEKFQILNQIDNCYELSEITKEGIYELCRKEKFEDCLEWIAEYTKYWDYKED